MLLLEALVTEAKKAPWADIVQAHDLLSTYHLFVTKLEEVYAGEVVEFDDAMAMSLAKANAMHDLHDSTKHLPKDYETLLQLKKVKAMETGGSSKTVVELTSSAHAAVTGAFGQRLKEVAGEASLAVFVNFMTKEIRSDRMEEANKSAIAECKTVFDQAERTHAILVT